VIDLREQFGDIDIYLFDQLLRGRIRTGMRVFDAGCGGGRNLVYLLQAGYDVYAADPDRAAVAAVRDLAAAHAPHLPPDRFRVEPLEALTFPEGFADVVISSAVLHFARDDRQFDAMLRGTWRALAPRGLLFARLASSIGMEARVRPVGAGRYLLPDGSERYLVDEQRLMTLTADLEGELVDPIKTTVVQGMRCMTTWVLRKR
jgi:SAM-dependent methyltransferase